MPGLGDIGGQSQHSHLGSEFGECCDAHAQLQADQQVRRTKRKRPFDQNRLLSGLRDSTEDKVNTKRSRRCGFPQVILSITSVLLLSVVLFCFVVSKLAFVRLSDTVRAGRTTGLSDDSLDAHVAINMLVLAIMIPQAWGLFLAVWKHCYKAARTNPSPTWAAVGWTIFDVFFESAGVTVFSICVATRVHAVTALVMMSSIFAFPAFKKLRDAWRESYRRAEEARPLLASDGASLNDSILKAHAKVHAPSILGRLADIFALLAQGLSFAYVPVLVYFFAPSGKQGDVGGDWVTLVLGIASLAAMSLSWLAPVQQQRVSTGVPFGMYTARVKSSVIASFFRLVFTAVAVFVVVELEPELDSAKIIEYAMTHLNDDKLLVPFCTQILAGFLGYNAARIACMMDMQVFCYAIPLTLTTPVAVAALITFDKLPLNFDVAPMPDSLLWPMLGCCAAVWLSSMIVTRRSTWNTKMPRLALDETLFYQPTFNGIFLEQYTLLNRRPPELGLYRGEPVTSAKEQLAKSRIFICTTMYHEDEKEMRQLLRSVMQVDAEIGRDVCEAHIWMDGGIVNNGLGRWALQLVNCIEMEVQARRDEYQEHTGDRLSEDWIQTGQRVRTPYGERLEWELPLGGMVLCVHLKDPVKVKAKKRWSQCMYMFYMLQFRCPRWQEGTHQGGANHTNYVLTTDADVRFEPSDVLALLMQIARDQRVGAVCARTHPMGDGPLVWYQIFDYAIGHWFQKTAEHVLGTVLCCPGCFSMYRFDALRDVLLTYSSSVQEARQFLTKDMGEDRWLCTILVLAGWRLDYCAAAFDYTYCPVDFNEFFNQRRRWIPSTLANIMELLMDWRTASRYNDSISFMFILYQAVMLFSAVVCPGTVLLIMIGGINYSMGWDNSVVEGVLFSVTIAFTAICLYAPQKFQLFCAKILTVLFALLMGAVAIGVAAEIADEIDKQTHPPKHHNSTTTTTTTTPTTKPPSPPPTLAPNQYYYNGSNDITGLSQPQQDSVLYAEEMVNATVLVVADVVDYYASTTMAAAMGDMDPSTTTKPHGINGTNISVSTVYLAAIIAMFLLAGVFHIDESLALIHGVWYLLCLPGGYLFLLIYSFCNLNDRSWGTRVAYVEKKSAAATGGFLSGCGRYDGENFAHFLGRALCCRLGVPEPVEEEVVSPYSMMADMRREVVIEWSLDADGRTAQSRSVNELKRFLEQEQISSPGGSSSSSNSSNDQNQNQNQNQLEALQEMSRLTKSALEACPELGDFGVWTMQWDKERGAFVGHRRGPHGVPTDPEFRQQMLRDIDQVLSGSNMPSRYSWVAVQREESNDVLNNGDVQTTAEFLATRGLSSRHLQEILVGNGYEDTTFLVDLNMAKLERMGLSKMLTSKSLLKKLLAATSKLPRDHIPNLIPVNLTEWLRMLRLARYDTNFDRFGYRDGDLGLITDLRGADLKAMGIVVPAHAQKLLLAINQLRTLFGKGHVTEDNRSDRSKHSLYHARKAVGIMDVRTIPDSLLAPYNIFESEEQFWHAIVESKLDPKLEPISNLTGLKSSLEGLRNMVVMTVFIINAMWLVLMLNLASGSSNNLQLLNSNPLGLLFLVIYGGIFLVQFLTLIVHRASTALQVLAAIELPWRTPLVSGTNGYAASRTVTPSGDVSVDTRSMSLGMQ